MYVLVTGGAGYIGSHTVVELINNGYKVIIVDNLCNSSYDAVSRIEYIVQKPVLFFNVDIRDSEKLAAIFDQYQVSSVIHFAALKAVGDSTKIPLDYYDNNAIGTIRLLEVMKLKNVHKIVFSSSATVYGDVTRFGTDEYIPIPEHCPNQPTNPYGMTKYIIENMIHDVYSSEPETWNAAILRYFNPVGAHPSGLIGEDPLGVPQNLLPYLAQVAIGRREKLFVFGNDYDSHDGTPIRDYIHVVDLAKGHLAALAYLDKNGAKGLFREWNLGTGKGSTVFDLYHAFCKAAGKKLPFEVTGRRKGDVLNLTANPQRANEELKWKAEKTIDEACTDLWKWTTENPLGYTVKGYEWNNPTKDNYHYRVHTVKSANGDLEVSFLNYGASIQSVTYKGQKLALDLQTEREYHEQGSFLGTTVGRYANRIDGKGKFDANDREGVTLHGGANGFHRQNFQGPAVTKNGSIYTLEFVLVDAHLNNGFPGDLETKVKYTVTDSSIEVEYEAKLLGDKAEETFVNLTNHAYWNISNDTGVNGVDGTIVKLPTSKYIEVDSKNLPTGRILNREVGGFFPGEQFDSCYILNEHPELKLDTRSSPLVTVFEASHPATKINFSIQTTEPSFQLYSGDFTDIPGKYGARSAFCVEPGRFVDAINNEEWKKLVTLKKGDTYGSKIKYIIN